MLFQLQDVTKTYGSVTALNNLSVSVPEGAIGLLGPNGSGKTTMIRTLLGLIEIDRGAGEVLGMDIRKRQLDIRAAVGFAPEDECLFPRVVGVEFVAYAGELVGMPSKDALQRSHEVLDYVGLGEARYRKVETYSTGMKQRLRLAAAIVHDPKLLILDEPTNGMDPAGREDVLQLARDLSHNKGMSLVFSSHLLPDVEAVCTHIVVLGSGKLLTSGNIQDLKQLHEQCFEVRLKGASEAFAQRLSAQGCSSEARDDLLVVRIPEGKSPQLIWQIAAEQKQQVRHLRAQRSTLEEVFLKAVESNEMPIFDQGYQHWSGRLIGHAWRPLAIARHGVRTGTRGLVAKLVLYSAMVPPLALAGMLCAWGLLERFFSSTRGHHVNSADIPIYVQMLSSFLMPELISDPVHYRVAFWTLAYDFFLKYELQLAMVVILIVGPNLISQDLRFNALPLYLSRPVRRMDYFLGKLGVIFAYLAMVIIAPSVLAYVLGLAFTLDVSIIPDTFRVLVGAVVYGLVVAVSAGLLVLALSALSRNSRYISLMWLAVWLVTFLMSTIMQGMNDSQIRREAYRSVVTHQRQVYSNSRQNMTNEDWQRQRMKIQEERAEAMDKMEATLYEQSRHDWRPLISYTDDLGRIRRWLLGSDKQWKTVAAVLPGEENEQAFLGEHVGPAYPWYWSAGVLLGLMGLSACILHYPIRTLDRLK